MGSKPVVDPSMLPDVIPNEVLKMLNIASGGSNSQSPIQTTPPSTTRTPTKSSADIRAKVMSMLNKEKPPKKDNTSSPSLPPEVLKALNMAGPAPLKPKSSRKPDLKKSVLAPDIMNMLQKSMKSPFPQTPAPTAPSRFEYTPATKTIPSRQPDWFGARPTQPPRTPAPRPSNGRSRFMSTTRPGPRPTRPPTRFPSLSFNSNPFDGSNGGNPFGGSKNNGGNPFGGSSNNGGNQMEALLSMLQGGSMGGMGGMGGLEMGLGSGGMGMPTQDPFAELMGMYM